MPACFIIAPSGTNLETLTRVVRDNGWRVLNQESVDRDAAAFLGTAAELIDGADAVLVVITDRYSPNTLFEAGLAMGLQRPLMLIADDSAIGDGLVPDRVLAGVPRVRAKPGDGGVLRFHVGAFLDGAEKGLGRPRSKSIRKSLERPKIRVEQPYSRLEAYLLEEFELASEVEAVRLHPSIGRSDVFRPDFALWLRDPHGMIPNPLVVEAVGSGAALDGIGLKMERLRTYALESDIGATMLVNELYDGPIELLSLNPMTFNIGRLELQRLLRSASLIPEMVRARNVLAHSAA